MGVNNIGTSGSLDPNFPTAVMLYNRNAIGSKLEKNRQCC